MSARSFSRLARSFIKTAVIGVLALAALPLYSQTLTQRWSNLVADAAYPNIEGRVVRTGPDRQVVTALNTYSSSSYDDVLVIKSDASTGARIWQSASNPPANYGDFVTGMAIDSAGDVIVVGGRNSYLNYKPRFFSAKYSGVDGSVLWERIFLVNNHASFSGVAVDSQDNVIAVGTTRTNDSSPIASDFVTYKFSSTTGETLWMNQYSTSGASTTTDFAKAVTLDAADNVLVTGYGNNRGSLQAVILKLASTDGKVLWNQVRLDSGGSTSGEDIVVDSSGDVLVACSTSQGRGGFRTVKYRGSDGTELWVNHHESDQIDVPSCLAVDPSGNVAVTGHTYAGTANDDILTLYISGNSGSTLWTRTYDGGITSGGLIKDDHGLAVRFDPSGNPVVAGSSNNASGNGPDTMVLKYAAANGNTLIQQRIAVSNGDDNPLTKDSLDVGHGHVTVTGRHYASGGLYRAFTFRLNDPVDPAVTTLAAGQVGSTTARLRSDVQPHGYATTVRYFYGTAASALTLSTPARSVGNGFAEVEDEETLSGLLPGTTYFYQARATGNSQTVQGETLTFTTPSNDATLASLGVSTGALQPAFLPSTTGYTITLPFAVTTLSATPTTTHPAATLTMNSTPLASGATSAPFPLPVGNTIINTMVTAEDLITTRAYSIAVTRVPEKYVFAAATDVPVNAPGFTATGLAAEIELAFAPATGTDLTMIDNTGLGFITDRFSNLQHGQEIILSHGNARYRYVVNYYGGDGNDLVLTWANRRPYVWGYNNAGQLGLGTTVDATVPTALATGSALDGKTILSLATGYGHTLALCSDGSLFAWGSNSRGQLGNGSATGGSSRSLVPVEITGSGALAGKRIIAIAAGTLQSFALCSDGSLAGWGSNQWGLLGDGTSTDRNLPVAVDTTGFLAGKQIISVSTGEYLTLALCADGSIAGWGNNIRGALGSTAPGTTSTPVEVTRNGALLGKQVRSVIAGADAFAIYRCSDGTAAGLGWNNSGQLGNGNTSDASVPVRVVTSGILSGKSLRMVSPGNHHCVAFTTDGTAVTWGENILGTLGDNSTVNRSSPVAVQSSGVLQGKSIVSVNGSYFNSAALCADGTLAIWGYGGSGALGNGSTTTSNVPVAANPPATGEKFTYLSQGSSATHYVALAAVPLSNDSSLASLDLSAGSLQPAFSPGTTNYSTTVDSGLVSLTATPTTNSTYATVAVNGVTVPTGAASQLLAIQPGDNPVEIVVIAETGVTTTYSVTVHRPPLVADFDSPGDIGTVQTDYSARGNTVELSLGFIPAPGTVLTVIDLTGPGLIDGEFGNLTQGQHVVLVHDGTGYEFVANYYGGTGNDLVLQWAATRIATWGANRHGQLGNATFDDGLVPSPVENSGVLAGRTTTEVAAGYLHSIALCSDGTLASWGYNVNGQLGNGGTASESIPLEVDRGGVLAGKTIIAVAAGSFHNLALCSDGTLAAWGYNNHGQLGIGNTTICRVPALVDASGALAGKRIVGIAAGAYQSYAWCTDGSALAWGFNDDGELGDGTRASTSIPVAVDASGALSGRRITFIAAGQYHALALCEDGTLVSWGYNEHGQLGNQSTVASDTPVTISGLGGLAGKTVSRLSAGSAHSLVACTDHSLVSWGWNANGQLGFASGPDNTLPVVISPTPGSLLSATGIATGNFHSLAWFADGTLSAWGGNDNGQLGDGSTVGRSSSAPVDQSSFGSAARVIFASSGSSSSHNLVVMGVPHSVDPPATSSVANPAFAEGASDSDEDQDGIPALIEYAFGLDPERSDPGKLPQLRHEAGGLLFRFTTPPGVRGIIYGAEWSTTLGPNDWLPIPDTGEGDEHVFVIPAYPRAFIRLTVNPE
ncbi:cadherin-like beta sandwich domain-containing protein [Luteolibacter marinus]|uniref:RCC1 domain-containing protein n=1 Tax=Luteolibacter marinus TaxID=2776705 RepID=UPI001868A789|nr:cadherin-like beta sandwich domain-containing protein [Luteolibacter marinus]